MNWGQILGSIGGGISGYENAGNQQNASPYQQIGKALGGAANRAMKAKPMGSANPQGGFTGPTLPPSASGLPDDYNSPTGDARQDYENSYGTPGAAAGGTASGTSWTPTGMTSAPQAGSGQSGMGALQPGPSQNQQLQSQLQAQGQQLQAAPPQPLPTPPPQGLAQQPGAASPMLNRAPRYGMAPQPQGSMMAPMQGTAGAAGGGLFGTAPKPGGGSIPGLEPPTAESAIRRYSPIGPKNPAATMQPKPEDMSHRLPHRMQITPRIAVKLAKPKLPGLGAVKI